MADLYCPLCGNGLETRMGATWGGDGQLMDTLDGIICENRRGCGAAWSNFGEAANDAAKRDDRTKGEA